MQRALRLALLVCVSIAALAFTGSAFAAFTPKFTIHHSSPRTQGGGQTDLGFEITRDQDALARAAFYVPLGYTAAINQPAGTQVGTVSALVQLNAISPDTIPTLTGTIKTDDPAKYTSNPCSPGLHNAVLIIELTAAGQTLRVPVYADAVTTAPESTFAQFKLVVCLPSPNIPPAAGGATFGAKVLKATLTFPNTFTTPTAAGAYPWRGVFTPYPAGSGVPNAAGTVESRAIVRLNAQLTANVKVTNKKLKKILISGTLSESTFPIAGVSVKLFIGNAKRASQTTTTKANGKYAFGAKGKRKKVLTTKFHTQAVVPDRDIACAGPSIAPAGCVSATLSGFTINSRTVKVRI
jgi:hypothetical protein